MPHVVIRGTDGNLTVEIDGQRPQYLRAFRLLAESPDELPILQLDLDMTQVDVDIQAEVTHSQSATADVQRANQSLRQRQEELRHELEGAYERIRQLERGLTVTREGTRGYAGPQRTRADTVQEMGRTPRRRMRRNQAWRQRYNELFEEIASTSDAGSTLWPEITRVRVREEMARGGDPHPGRVFPGADDVRSRLEPTDSVATPERPVEASRPSHH